MIEWLLVKSPTNSVFLAVLDLILFRLADIEHILGNLSEAKVLYEQSLAIDRELGRSGDAALTERLIASLS